MAVTTLDPVVFRRNGNDTTELLYLCDEDLRLSEKYAYDYRDFESIFPNAKRYFYVACINWFRMEEFKVRWDVRGLDRNIESGICESIEAGRAEAEMAVLRCLGNGSLPREMF